MHALIIEVQPLIAMMLEEELRELGFTSFDTATTQDGAVAAAVRRHPQLITASVRLTDGSGNEAVAIICAQQSIPTIYVVSNPEEIETGIRGSVVIVKPFSKDALRQAVHRATQRMDDRSSSQAA